MPLEQIVKHLCDDTQKLCECLKTIERIANTLKEADEEKLTLALRLVDKVADADGKMVDQLNAVMAITKLVETS